MTPDIPLAYLTMTNVSPEVWATPLSEQDQILGRAPDSQIRVPASFRQVSRQHAVFSGKMEASYCVILVRVQEPK